MKGMKVFIILIINYFSVLRPKYIIHVTVPKY